MFKQIDLNLGFLKDSLCLKMNETDELKKKEVP